MRVEIDNYAWIKLSDLDGSQTEWLKNQLTIVQAVSREYRSRTECATVPCFVEDKQRQTIGIAREFFFGKVTRNHDLVYKASFGEPWPQRSDLPVDGEAN